MAFSSIFKNYHEICGLFNNFADVFPENMNIADIKLRERPLLLAPMEDVTDASFRYVCKMFGADMMYTEFVSSDGLVRDAKKSLDKLTVYDYERPIGIQIYGHIPEAMVEAAKMAEAAGPEPTPPSVDSDGTPIVETTIYSGVAIKNGTEIDIDTAALLAAGPTQVLPAEGPQVLIVHTHGSEAYTPDSRDYYEETDTDRTEDTNYNVVRVGDELAAALTEQGLNVLHDREIYDYPSYTGSYSRSGAAVEEYLEQYPDIAVVIDLHRDALGDADVTYKTVAELSGESCSQVMLLVGTGESGLWHPQWEQNLRLALYLQDAVNDRYPTLMRPVSVTPERYNQHLTTGSLILEVGSNGNTLREALNAVRLFAQAAGPALLSLVKTAF